MFLRYYVLLCCDACNQNALLKNESLNIKFFPNSHDNCILMQFNITIVLFVYKNCLFTCSLAAKRNYFKLKSIFFVYKALSLAKGMFFFNTSENIL